VRHDTVWGSATAPPSPGATLARRDVLMQARALVAVRPEATLGEVVSLMVTRHCRAVFVTDDASRPLSVVTPTDVLRIMVERHGPKVGDVTLAPPAAAQQPQGAAAGEMGPPLPPLAEGPQSDTPAA
jgi:CBS domain-containing protein